MFCGVFAFHVKRHRWPTVVAFLSPYIFAWQVKDRWFISSPQIQISFGVVAGRESGIKLPNETCRANCCGDPCDKGTAPFSLPILWLLIFCPAVF